MQPWTLGLPSLEVATDYPRSGDNYVPPIFAESLSKVQDAPLTSIPAIHDYSRPWDNPDSSELAPLPLQEVVDTIPEPDHPQHGRIDGTVATLVANLIDAP